MVLHRAANLLLNNLYELFGFPYFFLLDINMITFWSHVVDYSFREGLNNSGEDMVSQR